MFSSSALPGIFPLHAKLPASSRLCKQLLFLNSHQKHVFLIDVSIPCSAKPLQVLGSSKSPTIKTSSFAGLSSQLTEVGFEHWVPPRYQIHITRLQYSLYIQARSPEVPHQNQGNDSGLHLIAKHLLFLLQSFGIHGAKKTFHK